MTNYHHSPWLSFYQPSTKVNSNPRMFRYCRKLSLNHCSSDQSEHNKSCIPIPRPSVHFWMNTYINAYSILPYSSKRPRLIFPQEIVKIFFAHSLKKLTQQNQTKGKMEKKKDMTSMAIIQKGRILIFLILKGYNLSVLFIEFLNSIWRWSNNVPQ